MSDSLDNSEYEVKLDKLVYGGEALGRLPDGRAVFVPYALPGEKVRIRLVEEKRGFARAELLEIVSSSKERIQPMCKHFTICGGCHYQHIPYEVQLKEKTEILIDQLKRIGGFENPPVLEAVASPMQTNYRNHIQFNLDASGNLGFQKWRTNQVIAIEECFLPDKTLLDLWQQLDIGEDSQVDRLGLRIGREEDTMLILQNESEDPPEMNMNIPVSVVHLGPSGASVLGGSDHIQMEVLGRNFRVSAGSFFQVNNAMTEKMVTHLLDLLPLDQNTTLVDAYCGVGLFSTFLAPKVGTLIGIESSPSACDDFIENIEEFDNTTLYQGDVEEVLHDLEEQADIIVVDPPRAGLAPEVIDAITIIHKPKMLAYVSCDPATLSRDAKRLTIGGYELKQVTLFDLFPQTYHIESISIWEPTT